MLGVADNIVLIVLALLGSLAMWWVVGWFWPAERRIPHNDITGWQISVLGTTYAVIVGFMLFAAWADYRAADMNADRESSCLINLYWSASGLPDAQRVQVRKLALEYAETIINDEWPAMAEDRISHQASDVMQRLWAAVSQSQSLNASQQVSLEHTMGELGQITEHRRIRQLQSQSTLPTILWIVLNVGAVITLLSACLFGSQRPLLHVLQVLTLALLLSLSLVAVADVNRPFRGAVHVLPTGFENAKRIFEKYGTDGGQH